MDEYPKFERRKGEGVTMLVRSYNEFGEELFNRHHYSEATAERILAELNEAIKKKDT
jgi:hypothetical protein